MNHEELSSARGTSATFTCREGGLLRRGTLTLPSCRVGATLDAVTNHRLRGVSAANRKGQGHEDEHLIAPPSLLEGGSGVLL